MQKTRVLVVDDDEAVAETLGMVLNFSGFDAKVVCSGNAAVAFALDNDFEVLVSDVMMEPVNGVQTAIAVRIFGPAVACCSFQAISGRPQCSPRR